MATNNILDQKNNPPTVVNGGTGVATMTTAYAPVCAGTTATGNLQVASTGLTTSGYVLTSNGGSALPSFQAAAGGGGGALIYLASAVASTSTYLTFITAIDSTYDHYVLIGSGIVPGTDFDSVFCQFTTDGGSTWITGAANYTWSNRGIISNGTAVNEYNNGGFTAIAVTGSYSVVGIGANSGCSVDFMLHLPHPSNTALFNSIYGEARFDSQVALSNASVSYSFSGNYKLAEAINGIRFLVINSSSSASGTFTSGTIRLYGVANS